MAKKESAVEKEMINEKDMDMLEGVEVGKPRYPKYTLTYNQLMDFIKKNSPFDDTTDDMEVLRGMLKDNLIIRPLQPVIHNDVMVVSLVLEITIKDSEDQNRWIEPVRSYGVGFAPSRSPYQINYSVAKANALRNALEELGAEVKYTEVYVSNDTPTTKKTTSRKVVEPEEDLDDDPQDGPPKKDKLMCADCDSPIKGFTSSKGNKIYAAMLADMTFKKYGRELCRECSQQLYDADKPKNNNYRNSRR